ncbi:hypothetical protein PFICI_05676 [Pestalotiopsis fici W106-1]|uniref:F-box domain-containing protein n=1 Tax=Pestalotiopsis fici (strain W106-1 / CGMCC3.15140) TaxID=1229662 RepID=W3XCL7_PESFW|nr:uncharacterized protein PFICI_05676 [Pestalotiopsis fici W106-1]ETS83800.1 hypothetical protein PFICI_05676 [Pestalotiopsis fici W106-1]
MATRRSTRLQNIPTQQPASDKPDTHLVQAVGKGARPKSASKPSASKRAAASEPAKDKNDQPIRKKAKGNGKTSTVPSLDVSTVSANDKISILPPEILHMILGSISDQKDMSALGRTSKMFYSVMMPRLYGRVVVASMFHAHIAKLIRTLEPLLSIAQKKQLKKEGKYKGQQEKYPTGLNEKAIPACAGYAKQFVVGYCNPGRKHDYICYRYVEEALKVLKNLEVLDIVILNKSIAKGIASLPNLKALRLYVDCACDDLLPLASIKQLRHLEIKVSGVFNEPRNVFRTILQNSTTTLESLAIVGDSYGCQIFDDWAEKSKGKIAPDFVALKSLSLTGLEITEQLLKDFDQAFDFTQLRKLQCSTLIDPGCLLFPFLTGRFSSFHGTTDAPLGLRTLNLNMDESTWYHDQMQIQALFEAKCNFIASFDTLTTLELPGYVYSADHVPANPGFSDLLLRAILKHKNLRVLKLLHYGYSDRNHYPHLDANMIAALVDGLPQLREFEFVPMEERMPEISRELCRASNLEKLSCAPYSDEIKLISTIVGGFLSHLPSQVIASAQNGNFNWEDHYKLSRITSRRNWEIASNFRKVKRGSEKPEKIQVDGLGWEHGVKYRYVPDLVRIHVGYDPDFPFLKQAENCLS